MSLTALPEVLVNGEKYTVQYGGFEVCRKTKTVTLPKNSSQDLLAFALSRIAVIKEAQDPGLEPKDKFSPIKESIVNYVLVNWLKEKLDIKLVPKELHKSLLEKYDLYGDPESRLQLISCGGRSSLKTKDNKLVDFLARTEERFRAHGITSFEARKEVFEDYVNTFDVPDLKEIPLIDSLVGCNREEGDLSASDTKKIQDQFPNNAVIPPTAGTNYLPMVVFNEELKERAKKPPVKRKRFLDSGSIPKRFERWPSGQIFEPLGRSNYASGGSVVIDASGSMSLSHEQTITLARAFSFGIVGVYASNISNEKEYWDAGALFVIAKNGRCVSSSWRKRAGGGNGVDGPAVRWLMTQRSPRFLVCDLGFTGRADAGVGLEGFALTMEDIVKGRIQLISSRNAINAFLSYGPQALQDKGVINNNSDYISRYINGYFESKYNELRDKVMSTCVPK